MRTTHFLLIIMMLLTGCGETTHTPAQTPTPATQTETIRTPTPEPAQEDQFTIVMLGDSLTAGFGLAANEALPEQVALLLERNGFDVNMVNAGVSGDTTAGGLARYDWSVASANPDLLIVALGANDFLNNIPAATSRKNLSAIIERAQMDGVEIILASVEGGDTPEEEPGLQDYAEVYPDLAAKYDVPLFKDLLRDVRGDITRVQLDGLHPTREGVRVMATRMTKFIDPFLPEKDQTE